MNIKEAELQSGVSRRNIRFYEQKGLLKPDRNAENDYREYSDEDIHTLKLIRALRMVDMPIEQIQDVTCGEVPMKDALAGQRRKLKEQIKKLEAAIYFCDELSKENGEDLEEVLTRMDEPENRKLLNRKWPADYAQTLERFLWSLAAGLIPPVGWLIISYPVLVAALTSRVLIIMMCLVIPAVWAAVGYYFYGHGKRWQGLCAHIFPAVVCGFSVWQVEVPYGEMPHFLGEMRWYLCYLPETILSCLGVEWEHQQSLFILGFVLIAACFCLGALAAKLVGMWRARQEARGKERKEGGIAGLIAVYGAILLPVILLLSWPLIGVRSEAVKPEGAEAYIESLSVVKVWVGETEYAIPGGETGNDFLRLDEWKRRFFWSYGEVVMEVRLKDSRGSIPLDDDYVIEFYSDGTAKIYDTWSFFDAAYYTVPDDVVENILAYVTGENT